MSNPDQPTHVPPRADKLSHIAIVKPPARELGSTAVRLDTITRRDVCEGVSTDRAYEAHARPAIVFLNEICIDERLTEVHKVSIPPS